MCITFNAQSTKEAETIKEIYVVNIKINSKVIDNVVKFKSTEHMRTTTLFDDGVSTAN